MKKYIQNKRKTDEIVLESQENENRKCFLQSIVAASSKFSRTATDKHIHLVGGTYVADTYTSIKEKEEIKVKLKIIKP